MDFVTGVFATWLLEQLADIGRGRLAVLLLGDEQERALRSAAAAGIRLTGMDFHPDNDAQAEQLALVIDQVFTDPAPNASTPPGDTLLESLQAGIAAQLMPLGDANLTETGLSSADLLGVRAEQLAETLTTHVVREIVVRGAKGGPLMSLAIQLGHDVTHLQGQRIEAKLDQLARAIGHELGRFSVTAGAAALPGQVVVGEIPREPPGFVAREAVGRLADAALHGRVAVACAVTGLRGVGKTQVAAAYARFCVGAGWGLVGWVNAGTRDGMLAGLARIAERLGTADPEGDSVESARRLQEHLNTCTDASLLVFDNATDPDGLRPFLPVTGATQVVITSTDRSFAEFGEAVDVASFHRGQSLAYLQEQTALTDDVSADMVAAELGDLPLGLAQAAATIRGQRLAYLAYLERLRLVPVANLLGRVPAGNYPYSTAAALLLSIQAVEASDSSGLVERLLRALAVLSPDGVPRDLLVGAGTEWADLGETSVDTALQQCVAGSLLNWSVSGDAVIMHRLLGRVLRERDKTDGRWVSTMNSALSLLEPRLWAEREAWARRKEGAHLVEQIDALWEADTTSSAEPDLVTRQLRARSWAVRQLWATDDLSRAIDLARTTLADCEQALGHHHEQTLTSQNDLALALKSAGRFSEAIELFERTLADRERILGEDHPDTMTSRDGLAATLELMHDFGEASELFEQTLADRERVLGESHPDTVSSRNNLAVINMSMGVADTDLFEEILADREQILGPDHPDTITSRRNLAEACKRCNHPADKVIKLFGQTLTDRKRVIGEDHPDTLSSQSDLALAYYWADMPDKAIALAEHSLAEHERVLGPDHQRILHVRNNLALAYGAVGRFDEAVILLERTLADHERTMGTGDPHVEILRYNLAHAYERLRKDQEA